MVAAKIEMLNLRIESTPSLRQFNRKTFHGAGQCYGDASHACNVVIIPSRIYFGPTGDDLDRSGDNQRGHNNHGEYGQTPLSSSSRNRVNYVKAL
jgi:hypothetical protein